MLISRKDLGLLSTLGCAIALSACNPIEGNLEVKAPLALNATQTTEQNPFCEQEERVMDCTTTVTSGLQTLPPGRHQAVLDFDSKYSVRLTLPNGQSMREVKFSIPQGVKIPRQDGRFALAAEQIGQPVSLSGEVRTDVVLSEPRREYEFCDFIVERWSCRGRHGLHRSGNRRRACGYRRVRISGTRQVEFQFQQTTRTVTLALGDGNGSGQQAKFTGAQTARKKIYHFQGQCF